MKFKKLNYIDDTTSLVSIYASKRVEYFFHYWEFIFNYGTVSFDPFYLKSHRTIIDKVKLQINGNYKYARKFIKYFFVDDINFNNKNLIIKKTSKTKVRRALNEIKKLAKYNQYAWDRIKPQKIQTQLNTIQVWLDTIYPSLISENLIELLERNSELNQNDKDCIKQLTNYFIIELFNKGFDSKYIKEIPDALSDYNKFPFEKSFSDFQDKETYDNYKKTEWSKLTLKNQIEGIIRLIQRQSRSRFVIYRVYDVNWRLQPLRVLDVEFYNPNTGCNPKIQHRIPFKIFEETFTFKPEDYKDSSQCNACVNIVGIHEEQMYFKGFSKVRQALSIINRELELNGKVYYKNAFITNDNFDQICGSTDALNSGLKAIDEIDLFNQENLDYINRLNIEFEDDKAVLNLLSKVSEVLTDRDFYSPEKIWMILEATFGGELEIGNLFKDILKIYLKNNYLILWKSILSDSLNPEFIFSQPVLFYEFSVYEANNLGINMNHSDYGIRKFKNNVNSLKLKTELPFIVEIAEKIDLFLTNKVAFYKTVNNYIDYILKELYAQRNLTVHSNMSDQLFLLKQKELNSLMTIILSRFIYSYLKSSNNRSIKRTVKALKKNASTIS